METDEHPGPPRGLILSLGVIGIILGAAIAGEFVLRLQPGLGGNTSISGGTVVMPQGVGSNTALNFSPATATLIIGLNNTVTFVNSDSAVHTVTATDKSFGSGDIGPGKSWTNTFGTAGNFSYYCIYHSSWMKGKVIVKTLSAAGGFVVKIPHGTGSDASLNFSPSTFTLVAGVNNTVTFVNQDTDKHTVTASDGSFDSHDILAGMTWTHTFPVGTYSFHCIYHAYMKGTITVKSS